MEHWLERTKLLIGAEKLEKLEKSHVLVVGLGGVGAYSAEQICRAGVGEMTIVDGDNLHETNLNRQLAALHSTMSLPKAEVMGNRLLDINPNLKLTIIQEYIRDERMKEILSQKFDYVVDAIDTLSPKIFLIYDSVRNGHRLVSSMGSGGKLDPSRVQIADISKSFNCPLARILRKRLHRLGIREGFKVVFSSEEVPDGAMIPCEGEPNKKTTVGTISYMPPIFGCFMASVVVRDLLEA
ncbi:MAG TPA: tRNA threonylcarbamoyladenosine dehydratase [Tenuifilaceae bacterium]|nr:tRNA threonylcarbamoyladenosine dehydratase [Tenuifilaceae bacterium]HPE17388.1 tRNA threonylcarbamoyladenosine dehydratase [Tenuifilaceae bacterium]HPJ46637.1 tRNA threonylcarbamoyladenosine dehydratase [Tenuifilaceae bacterium]HPQ33505.1 tRNA threonylcarbamoyladenosine dehydratase [Tenuifilaceae bacterium]